MFWWPGYPMIRIFVSFLTLSPGYANFQLRWKSKRTSFTFEIWFWGFLRFGVKFSFFFSIFWKSCWKWESDELSGKRNSDDGQSIYIPNWFFLEFFAGEYWTDKVIKIHKIQSLASVAKALKNSLEIQTFAQKSRCKKKWNNKTHKTWPSWPSWPTGKLGTAGTGPSYLEWFPFRVSALP